MNFELSKEQSIRADLFLKKLLLKNGMTNVEAYSFFKDKDEAFFVARLLNKMELVKLVAPTYAEPFSLITVNGGIETLLNNGGLTTIAENRETERNKKSERENLELEKIKVDLALAQKTLKEFPRTKFLAWGGFIIGITLLVFRIIQWLTE